MSWSEETLEELRARLGEPTTEEVSDSSLSKFLDVALREYNRYRPKEATAELELVSGQSLYDLPDDVTRFKRLLRITGTAPKTVAGPGYGADRGLVDDLAGLSPADNWVEAAEHQANRSRDRKLYGGPDAFMEAGKIVVSPAPSADETALLIHLTDWTDDDVQDDSKRLADIMLYAEYRGFLRLSSVRRVRSVSRLGHQTVFGDSKESTDGAATALATWNLRVARPRIGPRK